MCLNRKHRRRAKLVVVKSQQLLDVHRPTLTNWLSAWGRVCMKMNFLRKRYFNWSRSYCCTYHCRQVEAEDITAAFSEFQVLTCIFSELSDNCIPILYQVFKLWPTMNYLSPGSEATRVWVIAELSLVVKGRGQDSSTTMRRRPLIFLWRGK